MSAAAVEAPLAPCTSCGRARRAASEDGRCSHCRGGSERDLAYLGEWTRGPGGVMRPTRPVDDLTPIEQRLLARLAANLARPVAIFPASCASCGCALEHEDETCPSCFLPWAERDAMRASWAGAWWAA